MAPPGPERDVSDAGPRRPDDRWWPFAARLPLGPRAVRLTAALVAVAVLALGWNAVRRAAQGRSSRFDETTEWSRALVQERENVYATRSSEGTHAKYPPAFFVAVQPFALLPRVPGAALWYALHLLLGGAAVVLAVRAFQAGRGPPAWGQVLAVLGLVVAVVITNLSTAQVNLALVFLVALALHLHARGRPLSAGLALGAAVAWKLTPALFLLWFAGRRATRVLLGALLGLVLAAGVLPALVLGPARALETTASWSGVIAHFAQVGALGEGLAGYRSTNQSLEAGVVRTLSDVPATGGGSTGHLLALPLATARGIAKGLALGLLALVALRLGRRRASPGAGADGGGAAPAEAGLVALLMLLLSPVSWWNHYAALIVPFAAAVETVRRLPPGSPRRRRLAVGTLLAGLLLLAGLVPALLALSLPLLGALLLLGLLLDGLRPAPAGG